MYCWLSLLFFNLQAWPVSFRNLLGSHQPFRTDSAGPEAEDSRSLAHSVPVVLQESLDGRSGCLRSRRMLRLVDRERSFSYCGICRRWAPEEPQRFVVDHDRVLHGTECIHEERSDGLRFSVRGSAFCWIYGGKPVRRRVGWDYDDSTVRESHRDAS